MLRVETGEINHSYCIGSTRGAGGFDYSAIRVPSELSADERARFDGLLWGHAVARAEWIELSRIQHPGPYFAEWIPKSGTAVRLNKAVRNRNRAEQQCEKCDGTGNWKNPNNCRDVRPCFACNSMGKRSALAKGMRTIEAGTRGTVVSAGERRSQYGTWSYGATALIRANDGQLFNAPTNSLQLDEEPNWKNAREKARSLFQAMTTWTCHTTGRAA